MGDIQDLESEQTSTSRRGPFMETCASQVVLRKVQMGQSVIFMEALTDASGGFFTQATFGEVEFSEVTVCPQENLEHGHLGTV